MYCSGLQCVAVCCSVLQCVAVCCSVLQCVVMCCNVLQCVVVYFETPSNPVVICSKSTLVRRSVLWYVAVYCNLLQCGFDALLHGFEIDVGQKF